MVLIGMRRRHHINVGHHNDGERLKMCDFVFLPARMQRCGSQGAATEPRMLRSEALRAVER